MTTGRAVILKWSADLAVRGSAVITFPILAQFAGAAGYGAYTQMNTIVGFIIPFASLSLSNVMVRFFVGKPWTRAVARRAWSIGTTVLLTGAAASALIALLAPVLNDLFLGSPIGTDLFLWGSLLILVGGVELWLLDLLRARDRLAAFSLFQVAQSALVVAAVAVMLPNGYSLVELVQATVVLKALAAAAMFMVFLARERVTHATVPDDEQAGYLRMIRFGLPFTLVGLGIWMVNLSDRLVIGAFMTPADLGLYGATYTLASVLVLPAAAFFLPAYPRLMDATLKRDARRLGEDVALFHRYLALALVPAAVFLATMIRPGLIVLGGAEFGVDVLVGALIVAGLFVDQWNGLAHYLLISADRPGFLQNVWLLTGAFNIAVNLVAVPLWGLRGAALVTFLSFLLLEAIVFRAASRHVDLSRHYQFRTTLRAGIASAIASAVAVASLAIFGTDLLGAVVGGLAFWVLYVVSATAMRELRPADWQTLMRALGLSRRPAKQEGGSPSPAA
jgi:O-antigen/teichoic acid export membrane protein